MIRRWYAGLCKRATDELTEETGKEYKTLGVFQPYGEQVDISDSYATAKAFDLKYTVETNIEEAVNEVALEVEHGLKNIGVHKHMSIPGKGNVKARVRMVVQYALAFEQNLIVVGTDHASEAITGFYTKWGDGAVDITPLSSLNKRQVRMLASYLGFRNRFWTKRLLPAFGKVRQTRKSSESATRITAIIWKARRSTLMFSRSSRAITTKPRTSAIRFQASNIRIPSK